MLLNELEGRSLAGTYPLGKILRSEDGRAWFATRYQDKSAAVFVVDAGKQEDEQVADLEAACRVKNLHLVGIERVGRARIEGRPVVYAILEATEESLVEVLQQRALTSDETAEITQSLVAGLGVLHERKLIHGQVHVGSVFAAGESVKLRTDCVKRAPANAKDKPETYAQDVGDVGALVFECLTQRKLTAPDDPAIQKLPTPFRSIVQSTVMGRWGLTEVSAALNKPTIEHRHPVPNPVPGVPPTNTTGPVKSRTSPAGMRSAALLETGGGKNSLRNTALIAALVMVIAAIGLFWYLRATPASAPTAAAPTSTASPTAQTSPAFAVAIKPSPMKTGTTKIGKPSASSPLGHPATPHAATATGGVLTPSAGGAVHSVWRVVVFTYSRESEAQHKMQTMLAEHPDLKPEVFTASGHEPFLVTVGGAMTHDTASALRDRVRGEGLPGDSYAQNYSH